MSEFQDKVVVVTGGVQGIGKCIREEFEREGAHVCVIDLQENDYFVGDIADQCTLEA
ncbi:MAG: SDR family NAD(P)-dependent oxidoreductase, partial [Erysipelotrichales bacterium]|nr:SDR family NAD(P)-dependent oxidoreductase [Erysipelotrichales bacterium]